MVHVSVLQKHGLRYADFHKTDKCTTALHPGPLYLISPNMNKKCGRYVQKFIHAPNKSMAFTALIPTKLIYSFRFFQH